MLSAPTVSGKTAALHERKFGGLGARLWTGPRSCAAHVWHTHTHNGKRKNKNRARKAVKENSSGTHTHTHTHTQWMRLWHITDIRPHTTHPANYSIERGRGLGGLAGGGGGGFSLCCYPTTATGEMGTNAGTLCVSSIQCSHLVLLLGTYPRAGGVCPTVSPQGHSASYDGHLRMGRRTPTPHLVLPPWYLSLKRSHYSSYPRSL